MADWLCCLARTTKVLCSNLSVTWHRMTLDKLLTAVCLESSGWCILITWEIYRRLGLVSVYGKLKGLSGGNLDQTSLLFRAVASNSCWKNIGLSKLSPDSTLYRKAGYSFFLLVGKNKGYSCRLKWQGFKFVHHENRLN